MPYQKLLDHYLNNPRNPFSQALDLINTFLVFIVCGIFIASTYPISPELIAQLYAIEWAITFLFCLEFFLRWYGKGLALRYLFSPMALVDLIAILPIFISPTNHWQFIRVLRVARILRVLRLLQHQEFFFGEVKDEHLRLARILFTLFSLIFIASALIYDIEHSYNPLGLATFFDAVYFTVVTLTTVGFGDIVPLSSGGRIITLLMIGTGAILIPVQLTGLAKSLLLASRKKKVECQFCGLLYHDPDASHCKACGHLIYQKTEGEIPY